jgi:hypothetical protein
MPFRYPAEPFPGIYSFLIEKERLPKIIENIILQAITHG